MDIYDCITEVFYGAMTFSPKAPLDTKERTIKLTIGNEIDNTIRECFKKREIDEEVEKPVKSGEGDKITNESPDLLTKLTKDLKNEKKLGRPKKKTVQKEAKDEKI